MRYLLFGGSFDPFHDGHLQAARVAQEHYLYNTEEAEKPSVTFIPLQSPFKGKRATTRQETAEVIQKIIHELEFTRMGCSLRLADDDPIKADFMINALEGFIHTMNLNTIPPKDTFGIILGSDVIKRFTEWKDWERILQQATLVVIPRPGYPISKEEIREAIPSEHLCLDLLESGLTPDISSTEIRNRQTEEPQVELPELVQEVEDMTVHCSCGDRTHSLMLHHLSFDGEFGSDEVWLDCDVHVKDSYSQYGFKGFLWRIRKAFRLIFTGYIEQQAHWWVDADFDDNGQESRLTQVGNWFIKAGEVSRANQELRTKQNNES